MAVRKMDRVALLCGLLVTPTATAQDNPLPGQGIPVDCVSRYEISLDKEFLADFMQSGALGLVMERKYSFALSQYAQAHDLYLEAHANLVDLGKNESCFPSPSKERMYARSRGQLDTDVKSLASKAAKTARVVSDLEEALELDGGAFKFLQKKGYHDTPELPPWLMEL